MRVGTCVRTLDKALRPPARKRFMCIEPSYLWFLRINTKSVWKPNCPVGAYECGGVLDHDSYVELSTVHRLGNVPFEIRSGDCDDLGVMPAAPLARVIEAFMEAGTIPAEQKKTVLAAVQSQDPDN